MSEGEQGDPDNKDVEEAAAHAARSIEHRREMQRDSVKAEAADGSEASDLEEDAAEHGEAARREEAKADSAARDADSGSGSADS